MIAQQTIIHQPVPQLPVKDVEEAQQYYRDVLGFEITWITPDKYIGAVARGDVGIFFARSENIIPNYHWIFADDVDLTYAELKNSGADIVEGIENKPWLLRQFAIRDNNGHIFYIHHAL